MTLDFEKVRSWLAVGARPSDTVARLLSKVFHNDHDHDVFYLHLHEWSYHDNSKAGLIPSKPRGKEVMEALQKERQLAAERQDM
jgi:hypothetical protein